MPKTLEQVFEQNVSRETFLKLKTYEGLLLKWQRAINLISPTTIEDLAERHFLDSAQLMEYLPNKDITLADMGSGAGFPGMVLAILGIKNVHLIESDVRKATFLRNVSRETFCTVHLHDIRAEDCKINNIDVFTARALATLTDLLGHMQKLMTPGYPSIGLFLKGEKHQEEIDKARKKFNFDIEMYQSLTDNTGKILKISNLTKK